MSAPITNTERKCMDIMEKIENEIPFIDVKPYSHNIINMNLNLIEELDNQERVVEFIRQNKNLMEKGWGWIVKDWDDEADIPIVGWRPQTRMGECEGCMALCEECELLVITQKEDLTPNSKLA